MRYYSKATGCTYLPSIHGGNMPSDVLTISEAVYLSVIANPEPGKVRDHDAEGLPILVDAQPTGPDVLAEAERQWRDGVINQVQWLINRNRDELELNLPPTLEVLKFSELLGYVQRLRDWPASPSFPNASDRPEAPTWLVDAV